VNPPESGQDGYSGPPLGLLYLAGSLRSVGVDVRVFDGYLHDWPMVEKTIREYRPDLVGVTCLTPGRHAALRVLGIAKEVDEKIATVMGGAHASIMWRQILSNYNVVDIIVVGEGEETIRKIATGASLDSIRGIAYKLGNGDVKYTGRRVNIVDLDTIALPTWDLVDLFAYPSRGNGIYNGVDTGREPRVPVSFGRGCSGSCSFCSSWWLWQGYRHRSPVNMVAELEYLYNRGARHFYFVDDSFTVDRAAILEFCELIIESGMRIAFMASARCDSVDQELLEKLHMAGCYELALGVESGCQRILDHIGKDTSVAVAERAIGLCKRSGIRATALLIVGSIGEDNRSILDTMRFLARTRPSGIGCVGGLWLLPGTKDYNHCKKTGIIDDDYWLGEEPVKVYKRGLGAGLTLKMWNTLVHHYGLLAPLLR